MLRDRPQLCALWGKRRGLRCGWASCIQHNTAQWKNTKPRLTDRPAYRPSVAKWISLWYVTTRWLHFDKWNESLVWSKYEEILLEGSVVTSDCKTGLPRLWYEITGEYGLCEEALKAEERVLPALAKLTATISTLLSIGPSNYLSACNKSALAGPVFVI